MPDPEAKHCIACGVELEPQHSFCWRCGTRRWTPPSPERPPPAPGTQPFSASTAATPVGTGVHLFFGLGAFLNLMLLAMTLPYFITATGRGRLVDQFIAAGVDPSGAAGLVVADGLILVTILLSGAMIHSVAYFGLRAHRRIGWLFAVIAASLWSLVLVGIPILATLLRREVRAAYQVR